MKASFPSLFLAWWVIYRIWKVSGIRLAFPLKREKLALLNQPPESFLEHDRFWGSIPANTELHTAMLLTLFITTLISVGFCTDVIL